MTLPRLEPVQWWSCPNCDVTDVTHEQQPHTRFHTCRNGMSTPMVPAGTACEIEYEPRGDYLGDDADWVQRDQDGRPFMAAVVTRDDGQDRAVYAPTANAKESR